MARTPFTFTTLPTEALGKVFPKLLLSSPHIKYPLRDGSKIRFWFNKWAGHQPLNVLPSIFYLSLKKSNIISDFFQSSNWNLHLRRDLRDEEIAELSSLLSLLNHLHPNPSMLDSRLWSFSSGSSSVSSFFLALSSPTPLLSYLDQFGTP